MGLEPSHISRTSVGARGLLEVGRGAQLFLTIRGDQ